MKKEKKIAYSDLVDLLLKLQEINQYYYSLFEEVDILKEELEEEKKKCSIKARQYNKHYPYLEKIEKEYNSYKTEIEDIKTRIEEYEERKKKIKTIKEFKAINSEIEYLIKDNAIKENAFLSKADNLEVKREKIQQTKDQIEEMEESIRIKQEGMEAILAERQSLINEKEKEKDKIRKKIPGSILGRFDRIYKSKKNIAIVPIVDQICQSCYIKIPKQKEIEIKNGDILHFCPYCSVILYGE